MGFLLARPTDTRRLTRYECLSQILAAARPASRPALKVQTDPGFSTGQGRSVKIPARFARGFATDAPQRRQAGWPLAACPDQPAFSLGG